MGIIYIGFHACITQLSVASTHHIMYMHTIRKATTTLSIMIMTATMMPTADELPGSDDPSNSTITGDEKLPAPTEVTAWICKYEGAIPDNKFITHGQYVQLYTLLHKH